MKSDAVPEDVKLAMPGKSFAGELPPLTEDEGRLADRLRAHVTKLAGDIGPRDVVRDYDALNQAVDFLTETMRGLGYEVGVQEFQCEGKTVKNLDAQIKGAGKPDEVVIVGAHYDSVRGCPAANDNGTGVAAVIEVARAMKEGKPRRTVRFVFWVNEEPPFFQTDEMGSVVYAKRCRRRGENVVAMLSLETIGYYSDEDGSQRYPAAFAPMFPRKGNYIAFVSNVESYDLLSQVIGSFRRDTKFPSEGIAAHERIPGVGFSDQWSFWQEGYPGVMVTDTALFRYPHYHTDEDTPDKIDYGRTARVVAGLTRVVAELANPGAGEK